MDTVNNTMGETEINRKTASFNVVSDNNKDVNEFIICSDSCLAKRQSQFKQSSNGLTEDLSEHYMRLLQEAGQNLSSRDVIISMLQQQLKKMEELYKRNIDETQEIRYKYCSASQEVSNLRKICQKIENDNQRLTTQTAEKLQREKEDDEKEILALRKEADQWKSQYEELLKRIDHIECGTNELRDLLSESREEPKIAPNFPTLDGEAMDEHFESVKNTLKNQNEKLDYVITKLERELTTANQRNACLEEQLTIIQIEVHKECVKTKELSEMSIEKLWEENAHLKEELDLVKTEKMFGDGANDVEQNLAAMLRNEIERLKLENEQLKEEKCNVDESLLSGDNCLETFKWENQELKKELEELKVRHIALEKVEELETNCSRLQREVREKNEIIEEMQFHNRTKTEDNLKKINELTRENEELKQKVCKLTDKSSKGETSIQTEKDIDLKQKYEELKKMYDEQLKTSMQHNQNCECEIQKITIKNTELQREILHMQEERNAVDEKTYSLYEGNKNLEKQISSMAGEIQELRVLKEGFEKEIALLKLTSGEFFDKQSEMHEVSCDCRDLEVAYGDTTQQKIPEITKLRDDLTQRDEIINALKSELQRLSPSTDLGETKTTNDNVWYQKYQESLIVMDQLQSQVIVLEQENEKLREPASKSDSISVAVGVSEATASNAMTVTNYSVKDLKFLIDELIRENTTLKLSLQNVLSNLEQKVNKLLRDSSKEYRDSNLGFELDVGDLELRTKRRGLVESTDSLQLRRSVSLKGYESCRRKCGQESQPYVTEVETAESIGEYRPRSEYHADASDEDSDYDRRRMAVIINEESRREHNTDTDENLEAITADTKTSDSIHIQQTGYAAGVHRAERTIYVNDQHSAPVEGDFLQVRRKSPGESMRLSVEVEPRRSHPEVKEWNREEKDHQERENYTESTLYSLKEKFQPEDAYKEKKRTREGATAYESSFNIRNMQEDGKKSCKTSCSKALNEEEISKIKTCRGSTNRHRDDSYEVRRLEEEAMRRYMADRHFEDRHTTNEEKKRTGNDSWVDDEDRHFTYENKKKPGKDLVVDEEYIQFKKNQKFVESRGWNEEFVYDEVRSEQQRSRSCHSQKTHSETNLLCRSRARKDEILPQKERCSYKIRVDDMKQADQLDFEKNKYYEEDREKQSVAGMSYDHYQSKKCKDANEKCIKNRIEKTIRMDDDEEEHSLLRKEMLSGKKYNEETYYDKDLAETYSREKYPKEERRDYVLPQPPKSCRKELNEGTIGTIRRERPLSAGRYQEENEGMKYRDPAENYNREKYLQEESRDYVIPQTPKTYRKEDILLRERQSSDGRYQVETGSNKFSEETGMYYQKDLANDFSREKYEKEDRREFSFSQSAKISRKEFNEDDVLREKQSMEGRYQGDKERKKHCKETCKYREKDLAENFGRETYPKEERRDYAMPQAPKSCRKELIQDPLLCERQSEGRYPEEKERKIYVEETSEYYAKDVSANYSREKYLKEERMDHVKSQQSKSFRKEFNEERPSEGRHQDEKETSKFYDNELTEDFSRVKYPKEETMDYGIPQPPKNYCTIEDTLLLERQTSDGRYQEEQASHVNEKQYRKVTSEDEDHLRESKTLRDKIALSTRKSVDMRTTYLSSREKMYTQIFSDIEENPLSDDKSPPEEDIPPEAEFCEMKENVSARESETLTNDRYCNESCDERLRLKLLTDEDVQQRRNKAPRKRCKSSLFETRNRHYSNISDGEEYPLEDSVSTERKYNDEDRLQLKEKMSSHSKRSLRNIDPARVEMNRREDRSPERSRNHVGPQSKDKIRLGESSLRRKESSLGVESMYSENEGNEHTPHVKMPMRYSKDLSDMEDFPLEENVPDSFSDHQTVEEGFCDIESTPVASMVCPVLTEFKKRKADRVKYFADDLSDSDDLFKDDKIPIEENDLPGTSYGSQLPTKPRDKSDDDSSSEDLEISAENRQLIDDIINEVTTQGNDQPFSFDSSDLEELTFGAKKIPFEDVTIPMTKFSEETENNVTQQVKDELTIDDENCSLPEDRPKSRSQDNITMLTETLQSADLIDNEEFPNASSRSSSNDMSQGNAAFPGGSNDSTTPQEEEEETAGEAKTVEEKNKPEVLFLEGIPNTSPSSPRFQYKNICFGEGNTEIKQKDEKIVQVKDRVGKSVETKDVKGTSTKDGCCSCLSDLNDDEAVLHVTKYETSKHEFVAPVAKTTRAVSCCRSPVNLKVEGQVKVSYKNKKGEVNVCTRQVEQNYMLHRTMPMNRIGLDLCVSRTENNVPSIIKLEVSEIDSRSIPMPCSNPCLPKQLMDVPANAFGCDNREDACKIEDQIKSLEKEICTGHTQMVSQVSKAIAVGEESAGCNKASAEKKTTCCQARCRSKNKEKDHKRAKSDPLYKKCQGLKRSRDGNTDEMPCSKKYSTAFFPQIQKPEVTGETSSAPEE